jgi:hypothetical protein
MKDKKDRDTLDWLDDADERRAKEEQEHARRLARREKLTDERSHLKVTPPDRKKS